MAKVVKHMKTIERTLSDRLATRELQVGMRVKQDWVNDDVFEIVRLSKCYAWLLPVNKVGTGYEPTRARRVTAKGNQAYRMDCQNEWLTTDGFNTIRRV
jgi:hypothetical protein